MQWLFDSFRDVQPWHWLALGAILVGIEIVSPTFYFLWPGLAAGVVGVALYFFPALNPQGQIILFALLAVFTTFAWKRFAPADWTSAKVKADSDGVLFCKMSNGKGPMPPWKHLPEKERWDLISYIRSLQGAPAKK